MLELFRELLRRSAERHNRLQPLKAEVKDGLLVVSVGIDLLGDCAASAPFIHDVGDLLRDEDGFRVTDPVAFAEDVAAELDRENTEAGDSLVTAAIEDAIENVVEAAGRGFAWPAVGLR